MAGRPAKRSIHINLDEEDYLWAVTRGFDFSEFQGSKPAGTPSPAGNGNRGVPPRPAASKLAVLQERLGARLQDLEITDGIDGLVVKPRRYLGDAWAEINEVVRSLGGKWQKGLKSTDGSWRIPTSSNS
jgi:hypothetical protein